MACCRAQSVAPALHIGQFVAAISVLRVLVPIFFSDDIKCFIYEENEEAKFHQELSLYTHCQLRMQPTAYSTGYIFTRVCVQPVTYSLSHGYPSRRAHRVPDSTQTELGSHET